MVSNIYGMNGQAYSGNPAFEMDNTQASDNNVFTGEKDGYSALKILEVYRVV